MTSLFSVWMKAPFNYSTRPIPRWVDPNIVPRDSKFSAGQIFHLDLWKGVLFDWNVVAVHWSWSCVWVDLHTFKMKQEQGGILWQVEDSWVSWSLWDRDKWLVSRKEFSVCISQCVFVCHQNRRRYWIIIAFYYISRFFPHIKPVIGQWRIN